MNPDEIKDTPVVKKKDTPVVKKKESPVVEKKVVVKQPEVNPELVKCQERLAFLNELTQVLQDNRFSRIGDIQNEGVKVAARILELTSII